MLFQAIILCNLMENYNGVMLEIYLDHKSQWPNEGLNRESLVYEVVTWPSGLGNYFVCKRFTV